MASSSARALVGMARGVAPRRMLSGHAPQRADGRRLAPANDPAAFHPKENVLADTNRWRLISLVATVPVIGYMLKIVTEDHPHNLEQPPAYEYIRISNKVPRFPWGNNDLIGSPADRAELAGKSH